MDCESVSFVAISSLNFPYRSRKYLTNLVKEIAEKENARFIVIAGHTLAGKQLDHELKNSVDEAMETERSATGKRTISSERRKEIRKGQAAAFIRETAESLDDFIPKIKDVNYHIVVAKAVYDRPIGHKILEVLSRHRNDIRLYDDPETKMTIQMAGFGDIRVMVPRKTPWFYENITGLMQRVFNSFSVRTFSPKPSLALVGCTGVAAYIPRYRGVPTIAVPALHKLDEQISNENMVGCVVVKIARDGGRFKNVVKVFDFRTAIFNEKEFGLPSDLGRRHRMVLDALQVGGAGLSTIRLRINYPPGSGTVVKRNWSPGATKKYVDELMAKRILVYSKKANRYCIRESLIEKASIALGDFLKSSRCLTQVVKSCWHVGALKTLYFSVLKNEPVLAEDADVIVMNGDVEQGISHNYEYNGEMLPIMNGPDKHGLLAAKMQAKILMDVFSSRWKKLNAARGNLKESLDKCLVYYAYKSGNHDEPRFSHSKNAIPLLIFDTELRRQLTLQIYEFLEKNAKNFSSELVEELVAQKVIRVGESRIVKIKGIPLGLKHPYQARTQSKGMRIQQSSSFFAQALEDLPDKSMKELSIVNVANFHEAATVFTSIFGHTTFGVMTGAQVHDTQFETNNNKVVDYGLAKTTACLNEKGQILWGSVEYESDIAECDKKIVFNDNPTNHDVSVLCEKLSKLFDMPWR